MPWAGISTRTPLSTMPVVRMNQMMFTHFVNTLPWPRRLPSSWLASLWPASLLCACKLFRIVVRWKMLLSGTPLVASTVRTDSTFASSAPLPPFVCQWTARWVINLRLVYLTQRLEVLIANRVRKACFMAIGVTTRCVRPAWLEALPIERDRAAATRARSGM